MDHLLAAAIKKLTTKEYFLKAGLLSQQLFFLLSIYVIGCESYSLTSNYSLKKTGENDKSAFVAS